MKELKAYQEFATKLLKIYDNDPEGFWEISMSRFLAYFARPSLLLKRSSNILELTFLLDSLEKDTQKLMNIIDERWKTKISCLKSARKQYIRDAFPVFAMLAIWVKEAGLQDILENYDQVLVAGIYAVVGYSILDDNLDSNKPIPAEILTSQLLLSEYERLCYQVFGDGKIQHDIFHKIYLKFLQSEIKEKQSRWVCSPYIEGKAVDLGTKGLNAVAPFILCLEKAGKADQTEKYLEVFLLIGAVIQMVDDWEDLKCDLEIGHYSYVTLGWKEYNQNSDIVVTALKGDRERVLKTYSECRKLLDNARVLLMDLNDKVIMKLLNVTEHRMEGYYKKEFSI